MTGADARQLMGMMVSTMQTIDAPGEAQAARLQGAALATSVRIASIGEPVPERMGQVVSNWSDADYAGPPWRAVETVLPDTVPSQTPQTPTRSAELNLLLGLP